VKQDITLLLLRNTEIGIDVEKRWREWINFEASVIENYGKMKLFMGRT
jgi:tRNA-(ms[2]io[6]A)-hydroxylase